MLLENTFDVAAARADAWRLLNDVPAVLPCMPGAELVEVVSENEWKAKLHVRLGPIALQFLADVTREEIDEPSGRVVLVTKAREARGRGSADARIESVVSDRPDAQTRVDLRTELELRGAVAQYGRGIVADVTARLTQDFADCLARKVQ
jgi:carbon monoxide dehydrogenase subunit G